MLKINFSLLKLFNARKDRIAALLEASTSAFPVICLCGWPNYVISVHSLVNVYSG